jgi:hypothetical protein
VTTEQPTTPRAALLAFADWIENQGPIVPRPPADYAFLAREYSERYERTVAGPSCACDEISHTLDQFVADIGGVARRVEQMAEDVMWLRLKATRDPDFEELDPVKAIALNAAAARYAEVDAPVIVKVARIFEAYLRDEPTRRCGVCGCTDDHACQGGCSWVSPDLCSRCAWTPVADGTESLREQWRAAQTARQLLTVFCAGGDHDGCPASLGVPCTCACHAKAIVL